MRTPISDKCICALWVQVERRLMLCGKGNEDPNRGNNLLGAIDERGRERERERERAPIINYNVTRWHFATITGTLIDEFVSN